uniref:C2H2-type domain-containing protein n=1 Tax=Heligmosomoides polygyrus TaxID=6339 RepID=A0A8L8K5E8_HELPZ
LSPMSTYATSDLGSSPRSSISVTSANLAPWMIFRESNKSSFDLDDGASDVCSKDLLSPGMMLSPAPYSPFSDCEDNETPYSAYARSPNLSPNPSTKSYLHFSFEQVRSSSSMSGRHHNLMVPESHSLDLELRRTVSSLKVPAATSRRLSSSGQYKKRLLQKYQEEQEERQASKQRSSSSPPPSATESEIDDSDLRSVSRLASRQPTIEEPPSSPPHDVARENLENAMRQALGGQNQIQMWMERQIVALQAVNMYNNVVNNGLLQAFALHDRLAKHIASRHRDRSASALTDDGSKSHKCHVCSKSFGRSDMLTRFSRRDMITRHLRTHVRPDGSTIDISLPIAQLSLTPSISPVPPNFASVSSQPTGDVRHLVGTKSGQLDVSSLSSGEKSAFSPTSASLLSPHSITSMSPASHSPTVLSRQSSLGGYLPSQDDKYGYSN